MAIKILVQTLKRKKIDVDEVINNRLVVSALTKMSSWGVPSWMIEFKSMFLSFFL